MKKILYLILTEAIMIAVMFGCMLILSGLGIEMEGFSRFIPFLCICLFTFLCARAIDKYSAKDLGFIWSYKTLSLSLIYLLIALTPFFFDLLTGRLNNSEDSLIVTILYYSIVGFSEELFFRGYVARKLKDMPMYAFVVVSSAMFAAIHFISSEQLNIFTYVLLFLFGAFFALLYKGAGSIIPLMIFHAAWDIGATYSAKYNNVLFTIFIWCIMLVITKLIHKGYCEKE